jgi:hypothetical protein
MRICANDRRPQSSNCGLQLRRSARGPVYGLARSWAREAYFRPSLCIAFPRSLIPQWHSMQRCRAYRCGGSTGYLGPTDLNPCFPFNPRRRNTARAPTWREKDITPLEAPQHDQESLAEAGLIS